MKTKKLPLRLTLALLTLVIVAPAALRAEAGDATAEQSVDKKAEQAQKRAARQKALLEKYDVNHNGKLDPEEKVVIKADREKAKAERARAKAEKSSETSSDTE